MPTLQIHRVTKVALTVPNKFPPTELRSTPFHSRDIVISYNDLQGEPQEINITLFSEEPIEVTS